MFISEYYIRLIKTMNLLQVVVVACDSRFGHFSLFRTSLSHSSSLPCGAHDATIPFSLLFNLETYGHDPASPSCNDKLLQDSQPLITLMALVTHAIQFLTLLNNPINFMSAVLVIPVSAQP